MTQDEQCERAEKAEADVERYDCAWRTAVYQLKQSRIEVERLRAALGRIDRISLGENHIALTDLGRVAIIHDIASEAMERKS